MLRTQVYLSEDQYKEIKLLSSRLNKPQSQVIREALGKGLSALTSQGVAQVLLEMASTAVETDDPDLSTNIDRYLYEEDDHS